MADPCNWRPLRRILTALDTLSAAASGADLIARLRAEASLGETSGMEAATECLLREAADALSRAEAEREEQDRKYGIMLGQQGFEVYAALRELVALKDIKDGRADNTLDYEARKPKAWERARRALGLSSAHEGKES